MRARWNGFGIPEVAAHSNAMDATALDFRGCFDRFLRRIEIGDCDICSGTRQRQRDLAADPASSASDECGLAGERKIFRIAQRFSSMGFGSAGQEIELPCNKATVCSKREVPS